MKICTRCEVNKELEDFHKHSECIGGRRNICKECVKKYQHENAASIRDRGVEYYLNHRDAIKESVSDWRKNNPDKVKNYRKKWREKNPKSSSQIMATRRAREKNQMGYMPSGAYACVLQYYNHCLYPGCGTTENLHVDHVISLASGGLHDISNLQVLCQYHNISKGKQNIDYRNSDIVKEIIV